ncbi:MAG: signal peptidase I [Lachnospiraceae bacterium]|nr:signal peptidase I [Lachnospiraceae bacterium]
MSKKSVVKEIISWVVILLVAFIIGNCLNKYVLMKAVIPSGSMENTLRVGDHVFGFRLAYLFSEPKRGDVVMFDWPDDETVLYVKRIIGLPGETVEITDGKVYIWNDKEGKDKTMLVEDYLKEEPVGSFGIFEVPEGCYFMLGDNRNSSLDSRKWNNKYVQKEKIRCKAWFRYKPDFGWIK